MFTPLRGRVKQRQARLDLQPEDLPLVQPNWFDLMTSERDDMPPRG